MTLPPPGRAKQRPRCCRRGMPVLERVCCRNRPPFLSGQRYLSAVRPLLVQERSDRARCDSSSRASKQDTMTPAASPKIHIERMMYRSSIAVAGETSASYALVKLIPAGGGAGASRPVGINLTLVLDVSGSMYEEDGTGISRLHRVQQAARAAISKLDPASTTLSVVAFAHDAQVVLPATPLSDKAKIEDVIDRIDRFDV